MSTVAEIIREARPDVAKEIVRAKILSDDKWLEHALLALYSKQTTEEQKQQMTKDENGRGFNGRDAELLSSFAKQLKERGWLSNKQKAICRRWLMKYAGQLVRIAKGEI